MYQIKFPEDRPEKPKRFGDRYNFYLQDAVDCPEFLVDLQTLESLAEKWGLQLLWTRDFYTLYKDAVKDQDLLNLMSVMKVFETFPAAEQMTSTPGEYDHAKQYLANNKGADQCQTLSKSEWEAISIY